MRVGLIACAATKLDRSAPARELYRSQLFIARWGRDAIYMCVLGEHYLAATDGLPYVENVIRCWTQRRRDRGMSSREAAMSIGVLTKYLREGRRFG